MLSEAPLMTPPTKPFDRFVVIVSDCHLSAGRLYEGRLNPYEDFFFDDQMVELLEHFSSGKYGTHSDGSPVEVEFFINGDFLDYLNVPIDGEFEVAVTEEMSLLKTDAILKAHPRVMRAIRDFAAHPGKSVTYLVGNHDADLFFPKVQERITRAWDPEGRYPSPVVKLIADTDRVRYPEGVEVHHGNQFESMHALDFRAPLIAQPQGHLEGFEGIFGDASDQANKPKPLLNLPWGSYYVLKIVNRLKAERSFLDKVRPIKVYFVFGLLFDTIFTLKYMFLTIYYFLRTRIGGTGLRLSLSQTIRMLRQERDFLLDLEDEARTYLDENPEIKTVIFGHTHKPLNKIYPDGRQYINTGTWTKMINLDWERLGQSYALTFALIRFKPPQGEQPAEAQCELRTWVGEVGPHRSYLG